MACKIMIVFLFVQGKGLDLIGNIFWRKRDIAQFHSFFMTLCKSIAGGVPMTLATL